MKNKDKFYIIPWLICIIIFNVLVFLVPKEVYGDNKYSVNFWIGYSFILFAFLVQFIINKYIFTDNIDKMFYRISMTRISNISLIVMMVVGILCMVVPIIPVWLGIILCIITLGISMYAINQEQVAISAVEKVDEKIKAKTNFIKNFILDIEALVDRVEEGETKTELRVLCSKVKYSDPVSSIELEDIEAEIQIRYSDFLKNYSNNSDERNKKNIKEISALIDDRNRMCKRLK